MIVDIASEEYQGKLNSVLKGLHSIGNIIDESSNIDISRLNFALGRYYEVLLELNSVYVSQLVIQSQVTIDYEVWYTDAFTEAKKLVLLEYSETKSIKPSLKEFEVSLKKHNMKEWIEWQKVREELQNRIKYLDLSRVLLDKYERILSTLSNNLRSEMKLVS